MPLRSLLLTVVRHGESQDNQKSIWAGWRDTPLSTTGMNQARALGQSFANVPLTAIFCSDLKRAAMTAKELHEENKSNPRPPLTQSPLLREQNFGQAEGKAWNEAEWAIPSHDDARTFRFPEGEDLEEVYARASQAVRKFIIPHIEAVRRGTVAHNAAGEVPHLVIVAHGIAIAELMRVFLSLHDRQPSVAPPWSDPRATYKRVRLENTGWHRLEFAIASSSSNTNRNGAPISGTVPNSGAESSNGSESAVASDAGEVQEAMVEDASEEGRSSVALAREETGGMKNVFVRVVCQNHAEHLRGFVSQAGSSSSSNAASSAAANALAGGGGAGPTTSSSSSASLLPSSSTAASLSSTATTSSSMSTSTLPPPAPATPIATKPSTPTPASARSLSAYDAKIMAREMERAGTAAMLTGAGGPGAGAGAGSDSHSSLHSLSAHQIPTSASSLYTAFSGYAGPPSSSHSFSHPSPSTPAPGSASDVWQSICVRILPLFNGEGLRCSIEELNDSVSLHVRRTLDRGPARALDALSADLTQLASTGMYTLNSKLAGLDDERLLTRLVELWSFFFGNVLPYIEGCFLPMQTDPVIVSLTSAKASVAPTALRTARIDVRRVVLAAFRAHIILPMFDRLFYLFAHIRELETDLAPFGRRLDALAPGTPGSNDGSTTAYPRLLQMTSVLASVLSDDEAQLAIDGLLRALRIGTKGSGPAPHGAGWSADPAARAAGRANGAQSSRENRRGWIPKSAAKHGPHAHANASAAANGSMAHLNNGAEDESHGGHLGTGGLGPVLMRPSGSTRGFGYQLSEEQYLTALRSPNHSPSLSTPNLDGDADAEDAGGTPIQRQEPYQPTSVTTMPGDGFGSVAEDSASEDGDGDGDGEGDGDAGGDGDADGESAGIALHEGDENQGDLEGVGAGDEEKEKERERERARAVGSGFEGSTWEEVEKELEGINAAGLGAGSASGDGTVTMHGE